MCRLSRIPRDLLAAASFFSAALFLPPHPTEAQQKPASTGASAQSAASPSEVALPPWLEKLNLSPQQEQQARTIIHDYEQDIAVVWRQFGDSYQQTIKVEAVLLTAIEDNLTDAQRNQARELRRKTAQREKSPTVAAADQTLFAGFSLTPEQEAAADRINAKYLSHLRTLNRDIAALHNRLVSLEADKIVEIEKILTKPQLAQLSEIRQSAPLPPPPVNAAPGATKK